jgi:hypothetical protein
LGHKTHGKREQNRRGWWGSEYASSKMSKWNLLFCWQISWLSQNIPRSKGVCVCVCAVFCLNFPNLFTLFVYTNEAKKVSNLYKAQGCQCLTFALRNLTSHESVYLSMSTSNCDH